MNQLLVSVQTRATTKNKPRLATVPQQLFPPYNTEPEKIKTINQTYCYSLPNHQKG